MKKLIIIVILFGAFAAKPVLAQKLGHVNSQEVLYALPDAKAAEAEIEKYTKELEKQIMDLQALAQDKMKQLEADKANLSASIVKSREKDIMDLQRSVQEQQMLAQQKLQKKEDELVSPLIEKVRKAIKDVAKAEGYTYIFDTQTLLYNEGGEDVTSLVKKELGL